MPSFKAVVFAVAAAALAALSQADYVIDPTTVAFSKRRKSFRRLHMATRKRSPDARDRAGAPLKGY